MRTWYQFTAKMVETAAFLGFALVVFGFILPGLAWLAIKLWATVLDALRVLG